MNEFLSKEGKDVSEREASINKDIEVANRIVYSRKKASS